jgi:hypothetical protein
MPKGKTFFVDICDCNHSMLQKYSADMTSRPQIGSRRPETWLQRLVNVNLQLHTSEVFIRFYSVKPNDVDFLRGSICVDSTHIEPRIKSTSFTYFIRVWTWQMKSEQVIWCTIDRFHFCILPFLIPCTYATQGQLCILQIQTRWRISLVIYLFTLQKNHLHKCAAYFSQFNAILISTQLYVTNIQAWCWGEYLDQRQRN